MRYVGSFLRRVLRDCWRRRCGLRASNRCRGSSGLRSRGSSGWSGEGDAGIDGGSCVCGDRSLRSWLRLLYSGAHPIRLQKELGTKVMRRQCQRGRAVAGDDKSEIANNKRARAANKS
jgi:hypothetical protein